MDNACTTPDPVKPITKKRKRKKKKPNKIQSDIVKSIIERDKYACVECGETEHLEVHHMVYKSHGGAHEPDNLITLCAWCHAEKHKNEPVYSLMISRIRKLETRAPHDTATNGK